MELKWDIILQMKGEFATFSLSYPEDGRVIKREYKGLRAEFKFPCEHLLNVECQMEMQIYA